MDNDLVGLEQRINTLIEECRRLIDENRKLKVERDSLLEDKKKLTENNRLARSRLESIVHRLRTLENSAS
ncbi:MAG: hypothetical protein P8J68_09290 [Arenicellaceae bacterium]|jgi:cell division protein ZapB|nr:hypothetical protein [Arenicellaceae bacterium]